MDIWEWGCLLVFIRSLEQSATGMDRLGWLKNRGILYTHAPPAGLVAASSAGLHSCSYETLKAFSSGGDNLKRYFDQR